MFDDYKLVSSNQHKLREYRRFGLNIDIASGLDLPEVNANDITVIKYKALDAGPKMIVEDTSLHIEGHDVGVNIRWMLDNLITLVGSKASWKVLIGVNTGEEILVFSGIVEGVIVAPSANVPSNGFGFDPYFKPLDSNLSMVELDHIGIKDQFSARKKAVENMITNNIDSKFTITDIPPWTGDYQH